MRLDEIELGKLAEEMHRYQGEWIVISVENRIVGHGRTCSEALANVDPDAEVVLFKVPPLDAALVLAGAR